MGPKVWFKVVLGVGLRHVGHVCHTLGALTFFIRLRAKSNIWEVDILN